MTRTICKDTYFSCPTRKVLPDSQCRQLHLKEKDLEAALLASIQSQIRLLMQTETADRKGESLAATEKEIQDCQAVINRHKAKQVATFEDYAEGRITRQEYLSRKEEMARQHEEVTAIYTELIAKRAELQQASDNLGKADLGRYACANELTRELLVELVKEIRVSGEDTLEIMWNFRE